MSVMGMEFHFGFVLIGDAAQLSYTDASAATTYDITIPPGEYFFKHDTAAKDIRTVITNLVNALAGISGFSFTTYADRQVEFGMDAAADTMLLLDTGNGDNTKLAEALGLYDNTGDLTYFESNNITDGYVMPNVLSSWFDEGGRTFETYDLTGHDVATAEVYETEGNGFSYASGTVKAVVGPVTWTGIAGDSVRGGWPSATQAVAGTTQNATWTTSIWRAMNTEYNTPTFYAEIGDTPEKYEYALRKALDRTSASQLRPGWTQNFNLVTDLLLLEDLT